MRGCATLHRESSSTATNRATLLFSLTEVFQPVVMLLSCLYFLYGKACLIDGYRRLWSQILACLQPRFRTTSLESFTRHERGAFSEHPPIFLFSNEARCQSSPIAASRSPVLSTSSMGSCVVYGFPDDLPSMPPTRYSGRALFALWEIFPAAASALITTRYAVQHESAVNVG
jgi:hypothetical protein